MDILRSLFSDDEFYFNIFDMLPEAIYIYNVKKELMYLNHAAEKLDGFSLKAGKGKTIFELYNFENDLDAERSPTLITLKTERPVNNYVLSYYMNGREITQICDSAPIYQNGILIGAYVIQRDLTNIRGIVEENIALKREIQQHQITNEPKAKQEISGLIGSSEAFVKSRELAIKAAQTDSTVMLVGETGSGKEVFARAIHNNSSRKNGPFLALNCAAIPESLIEGILFGTSKGVYTGAVEKEGLFAQANGGTIFLDEINSMPISSQAKLLRVLEERTIMKLGSGKETPIDVRILSSTNETQQKAISRQHLREDLFYRLSVVQIAIPPLKNRKEDISHLVKYFIEKYNHQFQKNILGIDRDVFRYFMDFSWPGNVRQLRTCVESAMNFAEDGKNITLKDLPLYIFENAEVEEERRAFPPYTRAPLFTEDTPSIMPTPREESSESIMAEIEKRKRDEIIAALQQCSGSKIETAKVLGISKQLLNYRLKKYGIK